MIVEYDKILYSADRDVFRIKGTQKIASLNFCTPEKIFDLGQKLMYGRAVKIARVC
ncbi:Uncharacterized protein dnm_084050 [Desulfonema magnum]|uniref:Uncharacterized protein n=1 Tax=Desulfonema magnum TaxID=45655 RepID=A0A975BVM4_9BACT|nr:Uncharacterized protein dnm_084050 [Desulfonema magnum]